MEAWHLRSGCRSSSKHSCALQQPTSSAPVLSPCALPRRFHVKKRNMSLWSFVADVAAVWRLAGWYNVSFAFVARNMHSPGATPHVDFQVKQGRLHLLPEGLSRGDWCSQVAFRASRLGHKSGLFLASSGIKHVRRWYCSLLQYRLKSKIPPSPLVRGRQPSIFLLRL